MDEGAKRETYTREKLMSPRSQKKRVTGTKHAPVSKAEMLIRKPVAEVFEAFINPDITSTFWFTNGSGRLEAGKQVQWDWEMYDMSIPVTALAIEPNTRIRIEWPGYGTPTVVEWVF